MPEVRLYGYVLDTDNRGIELANVYIEGSTMGTTTNQNGYYDITVEDVMCLDSSNIRPEEWQELARQIYSLRGGYDGIVQQRIGSQCGIALQRGDAR